MRIYQGCRKRMDIEPVEMSTISGNDTSTSSVSFIGLRSPVFDFLARTEKKEGEVTGDA